MSGLTRRGLLHTLARMAALWTTQAHAGSPLSAGPGIGLTGGAGDPETLSGDRGIGGTGVVGTIRGFGSIVVNGSHIAYPAGVRVTIDGRRATVADLRLGHVVQVLAGSANGALTTQAISVTSEVVGPVEAIDASAITVLGQQVVGVEELGIAPLALGTIVAVSGLRRFDGAIVASHVARHHAGGLQRIAGPVLPGSGGTMTIGDLAIEGLASSLLGRRVVVTGTRRGQAFRAVKVRTEPAVPSQGASRLSIEGYVALVDGELAFGSGLSLPAGAADASLGPGETARAVVTAVSDSAGGFSVESIQLEQDRHKGDRLRRSRVRAAGPKRDTGAAPPSSTRPGYGHRGASGRGGGGRGGGGAGGSR